MESCSSLEALLKKGQEQSAQGKYPVALETFQKALILEPRNVKALFNLGSTCYKLQDYQEALRYLTQALAIQEDYIPALCQKSLIYKQTNRDDLAKADFELVITISSQTYEDWIGKGSAFFELEQFEEALKSNDKAIALNPEAFEAWMYRGITLGHMERFKEALKSHDKAIALNPEAFEAWMYRGINLSNMERFQEALKSHDKAIALNPEAFEAWMYRGITLSHMGLQEKQDAIENFNNALEIRSNDYRLWFYKGITLYNLNRFNDALISYDHAITINPDVEDIWKRRSHCLSELVRLKELEVVRSSWEKILRIRTNNREHLYHYGNVLMRLKNFNQALEVYNKVIEIDASYAEVWNARGLVLDFLQNYEEAINSFDKAIDINSDYSEAWCNLGNVLCKTGDLEDAFDSYNQAVRINRDDADAWYRRGKVLNSLGRQLKALYSYENTLYIDDRSFVAWNAKGNVLGDLLRYPEAIEAYKNALKYSKNQFWRSWKNLGWIYINSGKDYRQALITWKTGLSKLQPESWSYQEGCGTLHHAIGKVYYREGLKQESRSFLHQARRNYEKAIEFLDKEPRLRRQVLEVLQNLCATYMVLGEIEKAEEVQRFSRELLNRLIEECQNPSKKKQLALQFAGLDQLTVNSYLQSGQLIKALETAEKGKNACLTWLLSGWSEQIKTCTWQEMLELLSPEKAIVYWHISPLSVTTFIIKYGCTEPILVNPSKILSPDDFSSSIRHLQNLEDWISDWNQLYEIYRKSKAGSNRDWRDQLPSLIDQLSQILDISAILTHIKSITQLVLVPHRDLHRFPLHALFPSNLLINYLPSIQTGINLDDREFCLEGKLLSVEHPRSEGFISLPFAEIESYVITEILDSLKPKRISDVHVIKKSIVDALKNEYTLFHFTGHSTYNFYQPQESALVLSGEEKLTLKEILDISLSEYHLVTLSACETAITGKQTITEEYVGLVSAFLSQRVTHVVSTLWTITDDSSSLLMIYFYWQLKKGKSPTDALSTASRWLRKLTYFRLERLYNLIFTKLPENERPLRPFLRRKLDQIRKMSIIDKKQKCFDHPYYYCAFTITGK